MVVSLSKPTRSRVAATEWQTYPDGTREIQLEIIPGQVRPYFPQKNKEFFIFLLQIYNHLRQPQLCLNFRLLKMLNKIKSTG